MLKNNEEVKHKENKFFSFQYHKIKWRSQTTKFKKFKKKRNLFYFATSLPLFYKIITVSNFIKYQKINLNCKSW